MRLLVPDVSGEVDVHAHYADGWLERGGIRANMVASADGAASAAGLTAGLQTAGDNRVFAALRDLADVVLVGWSTAAAEGYRPVRMTGQRRDRRIAFGLTPGLPIAVVTRSLGIDPSAPLLAAAADARTLVVTCARSPADRRAALAEVADVLVCGDDDVDYAAVRRELAARGLTRVLCEGGPTLLSQIVAADELDELCLSLTPLLAGPGAVRMLAGTPWSGAPRPIRLRSVLEEAGAVFLRYAAKARRDEH